MKIAVMCIYTEDIKELASITIHGNKLRYCKKNGYDLIVKTKNFDYKHLGFEKIKFVKSVIETGKYDWIYWCGCDTMVTNFNIKLESIIDEKYDFIIAKDLWDFNADSFLCRSSPNSIAFLKAVLDSYDTYIDQDGNAKDFGTRLPDGSARCWAEQGSIIDLYNMTDFKKIVKVVPQKVLNSYLYHLYASSWHQKGLDADGNDGSWSKGDFLLHMPGMPNQLRLNISKAIVKEVIGDDNEE